MSAVAQSVADDRSFPTLEALNMALRDDATRVPGATQAVPGEGPAGAPLAFVGEQPGDEEDRLGRPFVGPAGRLFDRALADAGLSRAQTYVTNAVKHFKFVQRGKRRIHEKPTSGEIVHARWWLDRELDLVRPRVVVALGATAGFALSGRRVAVTRDRGRLDFGNRPGYLTVHPSYVLRFRDETARREAYTAFVADLRAAADVTGAAE